jgi:branched-chain amino acid transport system substrate-binding protein
MKQRIQTLRRRDFLKFGMAGAAAASLTGRPVQPARAQERPIKIGHAAVMTGLLSSLGVSGNQAMKIFVKHVNEGGGLLGRKVELVSRDTQAKPDVATQEVRRLALDDQVDFVVTTDSSGVVLAISPLASQLKKIMVHGTGASKRFANVCNPYAFKAADSSRLFGYAAAKVMGAKAPEVKRWAGINPDYEWGRVVWEDFRTFFPRFLPTAEIAKELWPPFKAADFNPYITALLEAKVEGVVTSLWSGDLVNFIKQAKQFDFFKQIKVFMDMSSTTLDVCLALGNDMVPVWGSGYYYFGYEKNAVNRAFVRDYLAAFKTVPVSSAGSTYRAALFLKAAVERAKSIEPTAVAAAFKDLTIETPMGRDTMRGKDHEVISGAMVLGRTAPDSAYPYWTFSDLQTAAGTEAAVPEAEAKAC